MGFQTSGLFLILENFFIIFSFNELSLSWRKFFENWDETLQSPFFLIMGIIILIYVWLMVFFDLRDLLNKYLDKSVEESDKGLEEVEKLTKKRVTIKSESKIVKPNNFK